MRVAWSVDGVLRCVHLVLSVDTVSPWQSPVRVLWALCGPCCVLCAVPLLCARCVLCGLCAALCSRALCEHDCHVTPLVVWRWFSVLVTTSPRRGGTVCVRTGSRGSPDTASPGHHRRAAATAGEWYQAGPTRRLVCTVCGLLCCLSAVCSVVSMLHCDRELALKLDCRVRDLALLAR